HATPLTPPDHLPPRPQQTAPPLSPLPSSPTRRSSDLIDATSGYQLWADRFEEPLENRFVLEDRLARGIVAALGLSLTAAEQQRLDRKSTRLNSSHVSISYAVFCLKKKKRKLVASRMYV